MQYIEAVEYKSPARIKARIENITYYPFHIHEDTTELICVLEGEIDIFDAAARYTLQPGDVHIFNPMDPHQMEADDDVLLLTVQLELSHYSSTALSELESPGQAYFLCDTSSKRDLQSNDMRLLRFYMAKIFQSYTEGNSDLELEKLARNLLDHLLEHFRKYIYSGDKENPATIVRRQDNKYLYKDYSRVQRVSSYVEEHFREHLKLSDIAKKEFLSTSHLSRYLKETMGLSFSQLLSLLRCEEAARQLSFSKKTIDQIASEVGFSNRKHLATQFKKWYHLTPSEYRNSILKDLTLSAEATRIDPSNPEVQAIIERYLEEY